MNRAGGATEIRACAPVRTNQPMKAMVGWRVDVPLTHLADMPRARAAILQASPGYAGEPPEPAIPPGFTTAERAGGWTYATACL